MRTFVIGLLLSTAAWGQTTLIVSVQPPVEFASSRSLAVAPMIKPATNIEAPKPVIKPKVAVRNWMLLSATAHAAAGFDAWTTRHNISSGSIELNPILKPFANSNSIYPVLQVGPTLMDFVGWKMMSSKHRVLRKVWWVPQVASSAISLTCGIKNTRQF
jgi:hypothetical protein